MSQSTPDSVVIELDEAFARRDLEAVLSYYEEDAVLVVEPGRIARGKEQLRRVFEYLFTLNGTAKQLKTHVLEAGDMALFTSRWVFKGVDASGVPFERESIATSVFRRSGDGSWRMIIDNSYGPAVLGGD